MEAGRILPWNNAAPPLDAIRTWHKSTARAGMAPPHHATGERGSRDEPGTCPFILAKLLRICQASEQFVVMTHPTVPVLHFLLLAAAIPFFLAKHRGLCAPWKGPTGTDPREVQPLQPQLLPCHQLSNEEEFSCRATGSQMDVSCPSHNSVLAFSPIRREMLHPAPNLRNQHVEEGCPRGRCTFPALLIHAAISFQVPVWILSNVATLPAAPAGEDISTTS